MCIFDSLGEFPPVRDVEFPFSYSVCEYILALAFWACMQESMSCCLWRHRKNELHQQMWQWRSAPLSVCSKHKTIKTEAVAKEMHMELFLFSIPPLCPPFSSHLLLSLSLPLSLFTTHTHAQTPTHPRTHTVVFVGAIAPRQAAWNWSLQRVLDYQRDTATRKLGDTLERGREEHKREAGRGKECRGVSMGLGGGWSDQTGEGWGWGEDKDQKSLCSRTVNGEREKRKKKRLEWMH